MTYTQRNIKELKAALPRMREKVIAVAVLLALSVTMMASVSYAWYTLSLAPEAGNITTQVSSNGSLEVALAGLYDKDGKLIEPYASAIGDSFSAQGQNTVDANLTWGNLINLSQNYGIENIVLRPATLEPDSQYFLSSVKYGEDGRVEGSSTDFGFAVWQEVDKQEHTYKFVTSNSAFGVRSISSMKFDGGKTEVQIKFSKLSELATAARQNYATIMRKEPYTTALTNIVQAYLDVNISTAVKGIMGSGDAEVSDVDIDIKDANQLLNMLNDLYNNALLPFGDALAYMANMQLSFLYVNNYEPVTRETMSADALKALGIKMTNTLSKYAKLEASMKKGLVQLQDLLDDPGKTVVKWSALEPVVDSMISIKTIQVYRGDEYIGMDAIIAGVKTAVKNDGIGGVPTYMDGFPDPLPIQIRGGTIWEFEDLSGGRMFMVLNRLKLSYIINLATFNQSHLQTDLGNKQSRYAKDYESTETMIKHSVNTNMIAAETYGMVLDIWTRTNASDSLLTLDGLLDVEVSYEQEKIVVSGESESRLLYVYKRPTTVQSVAGQYATEEIPVFKASDGFYYTATGYVKMYVAEIVEKEVTDANDKVTKVPTVVDKTDEDGNRIPLTDADVEPKMKKVTKVVGFGGSNRVDNEWSEDADNDEISASQGSGSCFIFYANDPEAYAYAMELLSRVKFAFFDQNGNKLAEAKLATEYVLGDNGKYTIPIMITQTNHSVLTKDGDMIFGITKLEKNVATLITTVIYLEGDGLENSMVLSGEVLSGKLNIQFSSHTEKDLISIGNGDLALQTVSVTAGLTGQTSFEYNGQPKSVGLSATITGLSINEQTQVQAIFQRQISATQGVRMDPVTLTSAGGDNWTASCSFVMPGTYVLKSLWVDGIEYSIHDTLTVTITGLMIDYVDFCQDERERLELTADDYAIRDITVGFDSDYVPKKVEAKILTPNNDYITVPLGMVDSTTGVWSGKARFTSSGAYTLKYLVLDGQFYDVDALYESETEINKTFTAYLGLRANIYLDREGGLTFECDGELKTITVKAEILTDTGVPLKNLSNVSVQYRVRGSNELEDGLDTELMEWSEGYYVGTFNVDEVGFYSFAQMTVGSGQNANYITTAINAPTITCRAMDPPEYLDSSDSVDQVVLESADGVAYYKVNISNAKGVDRIHVVFKHSSGETVTVEAEYDLTENTCYYFPLPTLDGTHNGVWTVEQILLDGVVDPSGKVYSTTDPNAVDDYYVLDDIDFTYAAFDGFEITPTGALTVDNGVNFMVPQSMVTQVNLQNNIWTYNGLTASIDLKGIDWDTLSEKLGIAISEIELELKHRAGTSSAHGGYTTSYTETVTLQMQKHESGKWIITQGSVRLAGLYDTTMTVTLSNGKTYTKAGGLVTVKSKSPTATITDVTPDGTYAIDQSTNGSIEDTEYTVITDTSGFGRTYYYTVHTHASHLNGYSCSIQNGNVATVYYKCNHPGGDYDGGNRWSLGILQLGPTKWNYHKYVQPTVEIELKNLGNASKATLTFKDGAGTAAHIYNAPADTTKADYTWTAEGKQSMYIGLHTVVRNGADGKTVAGTVTANQLVFTYDANGDGTAETYTFSIPTITINNEY